MDRFGTQEFRELLEINAVPAVSIYMPIERQEMTNKALRLQFRAQVDEVVERLEASDKVEPTTYEPVVARLREMVEERNFWNRSGDGVAVFVAPGFEAVYFLPVAFDNQTVVGTNFHTRSLLDHIAAPSDYWVLAIGEKEVSFWEGTPTGVESIEIDNLPQTLQEALLIEQEPDQDGLNYQTGSNYTSGGSTTDSGGSRSLPSPMYHGHGGGKEEHKAYLRRYFSEVSKGIREYLGGAEGPVILAAVDFCHPLFKKASKLRNLADEGIEGNVHYWNDSQIYEAAWPIAKRQMNQRIDDALQRWERAFGRGNAETDPSTIGRRAVQGRIHKLLLNEDAELWGQYDRTTGEVERLDNNDAGDEDGALAADVFDEIAETVIQLGGEVVVIPSDKMPVDSGIGAILRGNGG